MYKFTKNHDASLIGSRFVDSANLVLLLQKNSSTSPNVYFKFSFPGKFPGKLKNILLNFL